MINWKDFYQCPIIFISWEKVEQCPCSIYGGAGWYFYDETWAYLYGPYHSHIEAAAQLFQYCETLEKENS